MMAAAIISLAVALAVALPLIGWLVYRVVSAPGWLADERIAHVKTKAELERLRFELDTIKPKLAKAERDRDIFEEEAANDVANPNAGLARGDVLGRVRRAAEASRAARDRAVPAVPVEPVRPPAAPERAAPAEVHGPLDPNERLL